MDPLTAALNAITALAELGKVIVEKTHPDQVTAIVERHNQNIERFIAFLDKFEGVFKRD